VKALERLSSTSRRPGTIGDTFFTVFERFCERVTSFVSGHWGTLTAVFLLAFGCIVFFREHDASLASRVERLMTMLSLTLLFLLQRSQTKATLSLQVKLNEILKAMHETDNHMINIEHLGEDELKELHDSYERLPVRSSTISWRGSNASFLTQPRYMGSTPPSCLLVTSMSCPPISTSIPRSRGATTRWSSPRRAPHSSETAQAGLDGQHKVPASRHADVHVLALPSA
jgi:low affinity Fe/Cu permease